MEQELSFQKRVLQKKTKTKTKTKTKCRKDYTCGIFSERRVCKDIKYDILSASLEPHTKTETKTKTQTKTKTKYRKDYTCGIFQKRREFKDIKTNTFKDLQGPSRDFKGLQGPSMTFKHPVFMQNSHILLCLVSPDIVLPEWMTT